MTADDRVQNIESTEVSVPVPSGEIYTKLWSPRGSSRSVPVILFHDSIGCVELWRQFPHSLATRLHCPVLAYDRLGYGQSSARRDAPSAQFVTDEVERSLPAILKYLGIHKFIGFGHSVGGAMAVVAAARRHLLCQAVITESAQAIVEPQTLASIAEAKLRFANPDELAKVQKYHGEKARWVVDTWTDTWLSPEFRQWGLTADLPHVRCPLLAIHGDQDEYGSLAFPEVLSTTTGGPAEKLILHKCGHVPHREQETRVLDGAEAFLMRHRPVGQNDLNNKSSV